MRRFILAVSMLLILPAVRSYADMDYFHSLTIDDGLSHSTVFCIMQDRLGFMWFGTKDGLCRYDGVSCKTYRNDPADKHSIGNNYIHAIYEDKNNNLWIGTADGAYIYERDKDIFRKFNAKTPEGKSIDKTVHCIVPDSEGNILLGVYWSGLFRYNPEEDSLWSLSYTDGSTSGLSSNGIWDIHADSNGIIWIATVGGGMNRYDTRTGEILFFYIPHRKSNDITCIEETDNRTLLLGTTSDGLWSFDKHTYAMQPYMNENDQDIYVRSILQFKEHIWVGTESGLLCYNKLSGTKKEYTLDYSNKHSLACNAVYSLYDDRDGGLWIGSYFGGINYISPNSWYFEKHFANGQPNTLSGNAIREIVEDRNGNLWIGTEDNGLNFYNRKTKKFRHFGPENSRLSYHNIHGLYLDGDSLYVGYFHKGLDVVNLKDFSVTNHTGGFGVPGKISDNNVFAICKDKRGQFWVGTIYGLNLFDPKTGIFKTVPQMTEVNVNDIMEDTRGLIWVASNYTGVYCYNPKTAQWTNYSCSPDNQHILSNRATSLSEDAAGNIWISTEGGGATVYSPAKGTFRTYTTTEGLPSNVVHKVVNGSNGRVWISTNNGLTELDPSTGTFYTHTHDNDLLCKQFNYKSGIETSDGKLYFGSVGGLIGLDPRQTLTPQNPPQVVITRFDLFNKEVKPTHNSRIIDSSIVYNPDITLSHKQSCFSFEFAALSYDNPEKNQYAYRLKGLENEWVYIEKNQRVNYLNVPYGRYEFQVKGRNSNGIWNENVTSVNIRIRPPFYASTIGVILEILLCLALLTALYILWIRKEDRERRKIIEKIKEEEMLATQQAKLTFFVNMTHEIRTPLSLIMAPYEQLSEMNIPDSDVTENLEVMGSNINRLINLTNELLDFSKIEKSGFTINLRLTDINELVQQSAKSFTRAFRDKSISLDINVPQKRIITNVDPEILTKIFTNLLNNALKFARGKVEVTLSDDLPSQGWFSLKITNDGPRINTENMENIFHPFFQEHGKDLPLGFGIGLSIVRQLSELHEGTVSLDDNSDGLVSFTAKLPKRDTQEQPFVIEEAELSYGADSDDRKTIIVADDESSMLHFISKSLSKDYNIIPCSDGEMVLEMLREKEVHLIVADLRMPKLNGLDLCKELKGSLEYSHIPLIILTAHNDAEIIVKAMEYGADSFINKPFSMKQLHATIKNLLLKSKQMRRTFRHDPEIPADDALMGVIDADFVSKITNIILSQKDGSECSIDFLASSMGISRSTLYRKIKDISSMPPNEFIRTCRLRHAAKLLDEGEYRVNEICYLVGFNSPSYFTKCFAQQFNLTPKEYRKRRNR